MAYKATPHHTGTCSHTRTQVAIRSVTDVAACLISLFLPAQHEQRPTPFVQPTIQLHLHNHDLLHVNTYTVVAYVRTRASGERSTDISNWPVIQILSFLGHANRVAGHCHAGLSISVWVQLFPRHSHAHRTGTSAWTRAAPMPTRECSTWTKDVVRCARWFSDNDNATSLCSVHSVFS